MKSLLLTLSLVLPFVATAGIGTLGSQAALKDDQPGIAAMEATLNTMLKGWDFFPLTRMGEELLNPLQSWPSGNAKFDTYVLTLGFGSDSIDTFELDEVAWGARNELLNRWARSSPKNHLPYLVLSNFWYNYAWKARGKGPSDLLSDEGRKKFIERLNMSRKFLEKSQELKANRLSPFYWKLAIQLGNSGNSSKESLLKAYENCRTLFPSYLRIFSTLGWALLPRWGDSGLLAEVFQKEMSRDPAVAAYGAAHNMQMLADDSNELPWILLGYPNRDTLWLALLGGIEKLDFDHPNSVQNLNLFVFLADSLGLPEKSAPWLKRLGGRMDTKFWNHRATPKRFEELDEKWRPR